MLTKEEFLRLCELSQLSLNDESEKRLAAQMGDIVDMIRHLPDIEEDYSPTDGIGEMTLRKDDITPSLSREEFLSVVPKTEAGCILLPHLKN